MTQPHPSHTPRSHTPPSHTPITSMMSPPEDVALVSFLRQYRPVPPPAPPEAEAQLMAAIAQMPHPPQADPGRWLGRHWKLHWKLTGAAILAGVSLGLGLGLTPQWQQARSPRLDDPQATELAELAELETFLENSWEGTLAQTSTTELDWSAIGWDDTTLEQEETAPAHAPEQS